MLHIVVGFTPKKVYIGLQPKRQLSYARDGQFLYFPGIDSQGPQLFVAQVDDWFYNKNRCHVAVGRVS